MHTFRQTDVTGPRPAINNTIRLYDISGGGGEEHYGPPPPPTPAGLIDNNERGGRV